MSDPARASDAAAFEIAVDSAVLRRTMSSFVTGVAVVTVECDGELVGMTLNSLTSVSLDPPLLLVCLADGARTAQAILDERRFVVNVLRKNQRSVAQHFARRGGVRGGGDVALARDALGVPYLRDALARVHCVLETTYPGGDHVIVVGRVHACAFHDGAPLVFHRAAYRDLTEEAHLAFWYW